MGTSFYQKVLEESGTFFLNIDCVTIVTDFRRLRNYFCFIIQRNNYEVYQIYYFNRNYFSVTLWI